MDSQRPAPWTPPSPVPDTLTTPRLVLRRYREGDEHALNLAVNQSRDTLFPWLPWARTAHLTLHDTIYDIVRFKQESDDLAVKSMLVLGVFDRATGALLGGTGFHTIFRDTHQAEIGYWMHSQARRKGLCTEATRWMISWMLTPSAEHLTGANGQPISGWGFRRIEILCAGGNTASRGVPTKIGLRLEQNRLRDRWVEDHGWQDTLCWGVLKDEWDREKHAIRAS